jgi:endonuclease/exonuclease/phosphatase family metal-dependent hydrolase
MKPTNLWNTQTFFSLALPTLTTMFGLQFLRLLFPSLVWYLGDTVKVAYVMLAPFAIGIFVASFLAALFRRALGSRVALLATVGGLGLARLVEQVSEIPALDLALAAMGTVLFTFFFPIYLAHTRAQGGDATRQFGLGFLLGVTFDTTIHGAFGTLDLSWQPGFVALIPVAIFVAAQLWLLARTSFGESKNTDASFVASLPLVAIPAFIFIALVVLQNVARATTLTGLTQPYALGLIAFSNLAGLVIAILVLRGHRWIVFLGALGLIVAMIPVPLAGATSMLIYFIGIVSAFALSVAIFDGASQTNRAGAGRATSANGIGWTIFVIVMFIYYISYDIRLGIPNEILPLISAIVVALAAIFSRATAPLARDWTPATIALACLLAPLVLVIGWREPGISAGKGFPVRVVTFNIHNGFNTDGRLDLEAIARVIEAQKPDVVGLQEIARGWAIDSSVDTLTWLSQRLQMPYIFGPTADAVWGNAILSKYPIKEWGNEKLPPADLLLKRGFLWARIDVGGGDELFLIAAHYYHVEKGTEIRQQQSPVIAQFWNQRPRTIFLGDLNAEPDSKEIQMLRDAGFKDSLAVFGKENAKTWPSHDLKQRLDYFWVSLDLKVSDLAIPQSTASDHLGIAVTVGK